MSGDDATKAPGGARRRPPPTAAVGDGPGDLTEVPTSERDGSSGERPEDDPDWLHPNRRFIHTDANADFRAFCQDCMRERTLTICYGAGGVGKTACALEFARWDRVRPLLDTYLSLPRGSIDPGLAQCRTVYFNAAGRETPKRVESEIVRLRLALSYVVSAAGGGPGAS